MIISAIDDSPMPEREQLLDTLRRHFGADRVELFLPRSADFDLNVTPRDAPPFRVTALDPATLTLDGLPDQNAVVAALVRQLLPDDFPRVIAFEPDGNVYVDLVPGITPAQIESGWRDISEGGF